MTAIQSVLVTDQRLRKKTKTKYVNPVFFKSIHGKFALTWKMLGGQPSLFGYVMSQ